MERVGRISDTKSRFSKSKVSVICGEGVGRISDTRGRGSKSNGFKVSVVSSSSKIFKSAVGCSRTVM